MFHFDFDRLRAIGLSTTLAERARQMAGRGQRPTTEIVADTDDHSADPTDAATALQLCRVVTVHRETVELHDGRSQAAARVLPRLQRGLLDAQTALAVGDWVLCATDPHATTWVQALVPPSTHIVRRDGDGSRHPVVSNVDRALIVMGLDDDFNLRRLERYLTLVHASGIAPLVVLTKADVAAAAPSLRDARLEQLQRRLPAGLEVIAIDATDPTSADRFAHVAFAGQTLVALGSSGAGKSTLTNTLLGADVQGTGAVRIHDSRGMHTTTARSLHLMPGGACIIDTPGLRTLRADVDEATLTASFGDVQALSAGCRFRDCRHVDEPGCAVRESVDPDRLRNFNKLLRETRRDTMTYVERREQLATWKARGKATREHMRVKRGER